MNLPKRSLLPAWLFIGLWAFSRLIMLQVWRATSTYIKSDVIYYFRQIESSASIHSQLVEYPTPVVALLRLLYRLSDGNVDGFVA